MSRTKHIQHETYIIAGEFKRHGQLGTKDLQPADFKTCVTSWDKYRLRLFRCSQIHFLMLHVEYTGKSQALKQFLHVAFFGKEHAHIC